MHRLKARGVAVGVLAAVLLAGPTLILCARSARGRVEGAFVLVLDVLVLAALVWLAAPLVGAERPGTAKYLALGAAVAVFPLSALTLLMHRKCDAGTGPVGSHFLNGDPKPDTAGWADIEDEYVWLLTLLVTRLNPLMPGAEARGTRAAIDAALQAVAESPDYRGLSRVSAVWAWRLFLGELDPQHCYTYRPEPRAPDERFGLLVFLHGHGTNYPFVVHLLRPLCDRLRLCLVAPSFGYGNWEARGGTEAIERAVRFGLTGFDADPGRVFLMGLSQGGAGVGRGGAALPGAFAGLIFVSPEMESQVLASPAFRDGWTGRPVLVIQGERDINVRPHTVDAACAALEAAGVKVTQHRDPDASHFLFFAQIDALTELIAGWAES